MAASVVGAPPIRMSGQAKAFGKASQTNPSNLKTPSAVANDEQFVLDAQRWWTKRSSSVSAVVVNQALYSEDGSYAVTENAMYSQLAACLYKRVNSLNRALGFNIVWTLESTEPWDWIFLAHRSRQL